MKNDAENHESIYEKKFYPINIDYNFSIFKFFV